MANPIRKHQVASLLQQALGEIFIQETPRLFGRVMITVTSVQMASNLSFAKVHLSFMLTDDKKNLLKSISKHKSEIKWLLGKRLGSKLRRIPDIQFYIDNSMEQAIHMERLMNSLDLPADTEATSTES
jgi:ribosome-binding factor A